MCRFKTPTPTYGVERERSKSRRDDLKRVTMTLQRFLKTLKTTKRTYPSSIYNLLISSSSTTQSHDSPGNPISDLSLSTLRRILSDPDIKSSKCVSFFQLILENPSLFSFQPDLRTHLSLSLRVLSERKFSVARKLLKTELLRYPFRDIASSVLDECPFERKVVARFFNSMIIGFSDSGRYDEVVDVFECMKNNNVKIDEKTLTLHLMNLKRSNEFELAYDFFRLMVAASELDVVSVYSLTVVVSALCRHGAIKRARELVEEVEIVKPNIVTFKFMIIDCCVKRWNFEELGLVLELMEKESVSLDLDSYKILIEGFASYGKIDEAERLVSTMHGEKLKVETYLYNLIINGYTRLGLVEKAFEIQSEMSSRGVVSNKDTYWGLVNGLCKAGKVFEAMRLFKELRVNEFEVDEAMYTTVIEGCYEGGMLDNALEVVAEMVREGFIPDGTVFERLADGLSEVNREEAAMMITFVVKSGIKPSFCSHVVKGEGNLSVVLAP